MAVVVVATLVVVGVVEVVTEDVVVVEIAVVDVVVAVVVDVVVDLAQDARSTMTPVAEIDWVSLGLGLVALTTVLGLIPFWMWIYFVYNPPIR